MAAVFSRHQRSSLGSGLVGFFRGLGIGSPTGPRDFRGLGIVSNREGCGAVNRLILTPPDFGDPMGLPSDSTNFWRVVFDDFARLLAMTPSYLPIIKLDMEMRRFQHHIIFLALQCSALGIGKGGVV